MILKEVPKIKIQKQLNFNENLKFHKLTKTHKVEKMYISNDKIVAARNTTRINNFQAKYKDYFLKHIALIESEIQNYTYQFTKEFNKDDYFESKEFEER